MKFCQNIEALAITKTQIVQHLDAYTKRTTLEGVWCRGVIVVITVVIWSLFQFIISVMIEGNRTY